MTRVSPDVASSTATTKAVISSAMGSQTSTLNGVAATQKSGNNAITSKSGSKPPKIAKRVSMAEDGSSTNGEPVIGGLQDEDESLEHAAALASPVKGSDSRKLTKVSSMCIS